LSSQLHKTKGIVLRSVKYGETSLVVTVFTQLFGVQSYIINGVRTSGKKGNSRAQLFNPASILELVVYHNELKQLNRVREYKWAVLYSHIFSDVPKNAVALFMVEILNKCLKQPEPNDELYHFVEDVFMQLDQSSGTVVANLPLFFTLHLAYFFGFRIDDNYSEQRKMLDLREGAFTDAMPAHPDFLEGKQAEVVSQFLKVMRPEESGELKLNHDFRRNLLLQIERYYSLHIPEFGSLKSLPVLRELLG
jgi:DNA repair protein RecO (recombination protein O)